MTEETKLIWKDWNEEDWINASYCDTCGLPLIMLEPEEGEDCGEMACVYCTWEEDQTSIFEGKIADLQSTIAAQEGIIKVVAFIFTLGLCRMAANDWDSDLVEPYACNGGEEDE